MTSASGNGADHFGPQGLIRGAEVLAEDGPSGGAGRRSRWCRCGAAGPVVAAGGHLTGGAVHACATGSAPGDGHRGAFVLAVRGLRCVVGFRGVAAAAVVRGGAAVAVAAVRTAMVTRVRSRGRVIMAPGARGSDVRSPYGSMLVIRCRTPRPRRARPAPLDPWCSIGRSYPAHRAGRGRGCPLSPAGSAG